MALDPSLVSPEGKQRGHLHGNKASFRDIMAGKGFVLKAAYPGVASRYLQAALQLQLSRLEHERVLTGSECTWPTQCSTESAQIAPLRKPHESSTGKAAPE